VRRSVYCTASLLVSSWRPTKFPNHLPRSSARLQSCNTSAKIGAFVRAKTNDWGVGILVAFDLELGTAEVEYFPSAASSERPRETCYRQASHSCMNQATSQNPRAGQRRCLHGSHTGTPGTGLRLLAANIHTRSPSSDPHGSPGSCAILD
jgi:hypothetical protein